MNLKERIKEMFRNYDPVTEDWETIKREQWFWMGFSVLGLIMAIYGINTDLRFSIIGLIAVILSIFNLAMWDLAEVRKELYELKEELKKERESRG